MLWTLFSFHCVLLGIVIIMYPREISYHFLFNKLCLDCHLKLFIKYVGLEERIFYPFSEAWLFVSACVCFYGAAHWNCMGVCQCCIQSCEDVHLNSMGIDSTCVQFCEAAHVRGLMSGCTDTGSLLPHSPQKTNYFHYLVYRNLYPEYPEVYLDSQITAKILDINTAFIFF